jgi:glutamate synthase (ferredoxin)
VNPIISPCYLIRCKCYKPLFVNEIIRDQVDKGFITGIEPDYAIANYNKAIARDSKIMNKIGILYLHSYRAAQILKF